MVLIASHEKVFPGNKYNSYIHTARSANLGYNENYELFLRTGRNIAQKMKFSMKNFHDGNCGFGNFY